MGRATLILIAIWLSAQAQAIPIPVITTDFRRGAYHHEGLFIGGEQGKEVSLLGVSWLSASQNRLERVVLRLGDAAGEPLKDKFPFYQVSVARNRIVIDISQMQRTRLEVAEIVRKLQKSRVISNADFTMDPEDSSTNLTFHLRRPVKLEVFRQPARGELVLDIVGSQVSVN